MDYEKLFREKRQELENEKRIITEENKIADNNLQNSAPHFYEFITQSALNNFEHGKCEVRFTTYPINHHRRKCSMYTVTNHPNISRLYEYDDNAQNKLCKKIAYDLGRHFKKINFSCVRDDDEATYLKFTWNPKDF